MIRKLAAALLTVVGAATLSATAAGAATSSTAVDTQPSHFVWTSPHSGAYTLINNGATNDNPNAILFVTNDATRGGVCGCIYNSTPIGVFYDAPAKKWGIFYEEDPGISVQAGLAFNVLVVPHATSNAFTITAGSSDTTGDTTFIDSAATNGNPNAILQVTPNGNPNGGPIGYNDGEVPGVWYDNTNAQWGVFNESGNGMAIGESFNVLVGSSSTAGGKTATVKATNLNRAGNCLIINNPVTNGDSNAFVLDTPNFDPKGVGGTFEPHETDVFYGGYGMNVCNGDNAPMVKNDAFNVLYWAS
jgi:hypothetical protein